MMMVENVDIPDTAALTVTIDEFIDEQYVLFENQSKRPCECDVMFNTSAAAHQRGIWRIRRA